MLSELALAVFPFISKSAQNIWTQRLDGNVNDQNWNDMSV